MSFFGKSTKIILTRDSFLELMLKNQDFKNYRELCGSWSARLLCLGLYDYEGKYRDANGNWDSGHKGIGLRPLMGHEAITFSNEKDKSTFLNKIGLLFFDDLTKVNQRKVYIKTLYDEAMNGTLRLKLENNIIPWNDFIPAGFNTSPNTQFDIYKVWKQLTNNGQDIANFRPPNVGGVKYPSSVGGTYLLQTIITLWQSTKFPNLGDQQWEDWALFFYGASMAVQAHVDANKRVSRAAYVQIILNSGISGRRAPNNLLSGKLANM